MPDDPDRIAPADRFVLTIDNQPDLGDWTSWSGIKIQHKVEELEEGGNGFFAHQLPAGLKYSPITFTRVVNKDTARVSKWFTEWASTGLRSNASVACLTAAGETVASWGLMDCLPSNYSASGGGSGKNEAVTESIEIVCQGLFEPGKG